MKPLIYTIIETKHIHGLLETFHKCFQLPVQLLDEQGEVLAVFGSSFHYCSMFQKHLPEGESCKKVHAEASRLAMRLGETYIFSCHSNLYHIVFPLVNNNSLLGSILAGPFLMDSPESLLLSEVAQKYAIPEDTLSQMRDEANQIPVFEPEQITHISRTLYYMCSGLITDGRKQFSMNQRKYDQQAKINESIQFYKSSSPENTSAYPYEKEKALTTKLKTKDIESAKALLNDLLGYVFFSEGNNLEVIKTRSLEIVSLLSRAAIEGGATSDNVLKVNNQVIRELQTVNNLDDLCYKLQESIEVFTHCMFDYIPSKSGELTKKAIRYISKNYASNLTLNQVADHVHLNPAYFSSLFKQSTGSSFKEYLNMVRIEESKRLLSNTDYSIMDISQAVGFEDQSYFTKIFKKYTGLTPREYR